MLDLLLSLNDVDYFSRRVVIALSATTNQYEIFGRILAEMRTRGLMQIVC